MSEDCVKSVIKNTPADFSSVPIFHWVQSAPPCPGIEVPAPDFTMSAVDQTGLNSNHTHTNWMKPLPYNEWLTQLLWAVAATQHTVSESMSVSGETSHSTQKPETTQISWCVKEMNKLLPGQQLAVQSGYFQGWISSLYQLSLSICTKQW